MIVFIICPCVFDIAMILSKTGGIVKASTRVTHDGMTHDSACFFIVAPLGRVSCIGVAEKSGDGASALFRETLSRALSLKLNIIDEAHSKARDKDILAGCLPCTGLGHKNFFSRTERPI